MDNENTLIPVLTQKDWNELFEMAEKQGIACYLYYALKQRKLEDAISVDWQHKIRVQLMHFSVGTLNPDNELVAKTKEELKWRVSLNDGYFPH